MSIGTSMLNYCDFIANWIAGLSFLGSFIWLVAPKYTAMEEGNEPEGKTGQIY